MPDKKIRGKRGVFRLTERLGALIEWTDVDKSIVVALLTFPFAAGLSVMGEFFLRTGAATDFLDAEVLRIASSCGWGFAAAWVAIAVWGFAIRGKDPGNQAIVYATSLLYGTSNIAFAYTLGYETNPWAIVILAGAGSISLVLFQRKPAMVGILCCFGIIAVTSVLDQFGIIPYAPMLKAAPYGNGRIEWWWRASMGIFTMFAVGLTLILLNNVIQQWREREEQLAEAYLLLKSQKEQLVRAESLATVGSLVTGAAHELRNPLGSVSAMLQSLREDLSLSRTLGEEEKKEALQAIAIALKGEGRARAIVDRLYGLSEDLWQQGNETDVRTVIQRLGQRYPGLQIKTGEIIPGVQINPKVYETILSNVIDNAFAAGGSEKPSLRVHSTGTAFADTRLLIFTIEDHGHGIPKAIRSQVFMPFFTGEKSGEGHGVGLGLYIVHELLSQLGGEVFLESEEGKGTQVTIRVPVLVTPA